MKICLNMIVRNEADRIERCLESLQSHIDFFVIADTGSTDDTKAIAWDFLSKAGVSGVIVNIPFINFGQTRNEALDAARREDHGCDFFLLLDADMELVASRNWKDTLDKIVPAYSVRQQAGSLTYRNARLLNTSFERAKYLCPTHEYLDAPTVDLDSIMFLDHADGANRPDKFQRDIVLLHKAIDVDPTNPRFWFYLAQSHRDAGENEEALTAYKKRVELGGWPEEAWNAQLNVAHCYKTRGDDAGFLREALKAHSMRPTRAEALYDIAHNFRVKGENASAYIFGSAAMDIPRPKDDVLFVNDYVYGAGAAEEVSIAAYYVDGKREQGFEVCNRLALDPNGYPSSRELARSNLFHYLQPLSLYAPSFQSREVDFTPLTGWKAMNPSVVKHMGQLWTTVRTVNYVMTDEGRYVINGKEADPTQPIDTRNFMLRLGAELNTEVVKEVLGPLPHPPAYPLVRGYEDMRLFSQNGSLHFIANVRETNAEGWCTQQRGVLFEEGDHFAVRQRKELQHTGSHEKNWMPIEFTDKFMYRVGVVHDGVNDYQATKCPYDANHISGGSQVIRFRTGYLALVHEARYSPYNGQRYYQHRFVKFNADLDVTYISLPFVFHERQIEFASGLCQHPDGKRLVISYGVRDSSARLGLVDASDVARMVGLKL